jgi:hypothetical protein
MGNWNKKAVSLTFNTVIIAVLSIIVLVVLLYFLLNSSQGANDGTACPLKGGICLDECSGIYADDSIAYEDDLCQNDKYCCLPGSGE